MKIRFATKITAVFLLICCAFGMLGSCGGRKYEPKSEWDRVLSEANFILTTEVPMLPKHWIEVGYIEKVYNESFNVDLDKMMVHTYEDFVYDAASGRSIAELIQEGVDIKDLEIEAEDGLGDLLATKEATEKIKNGYLFDEQVATLWWMNFCLPMEHIKKIDSDHLCAIYRVNSKYVGEMYAYIIFSREVRSADKFDVKNLKTDYECWNVEDFFLVSKKLSNSDFDGLKIGDFIDDAISIAPTVAINRRDNLNYCRNEVVDGIECVIKTSYIILTDGILALEFNDSVLANDFVLAKKTFYPYNSSDVPETIKIAIANPALFGN